jgi:hypothetical protein
VNCFPDIDRILRPRNLPPVRTGTSTIQSRGRLRKNGCWPDHKGNHRYRLCCRTMGEYPVGRYQTGVTKVESGGRVSWEPKF